MIMIEKGLNCETNKMVNQKIKIGTQNEYIAEILHERGIKIINKERISNKITKNKMLIDYTQEFVNEREKTNQKYK